MFCVCACMREREREGDRFSLVVVYEKVIENVFVCETEREREIEIKKKESECYRVVNLWVRERMRKRESK